MKFTKAELKELKKAMDFYDRTQPSILKPKAFHSAKDRLQRK